MLDTCKRLEKEGFQVTYLPVDKDGRVSPQRLATAHAPTRRVLVSIMLANNEIGTVNPVEEIGAVVKQRGVLFHIDAVQGAGKIPFDVNRSQADLVSLSGPQDVRAQGRGRAVRAAQAARAADRASSTAAGTSAACARAP